MGNGKGGAILCQPAERFLNLEFGFGIQAAGGLVQNQQMGIVENSAGNGDTLSLPAGERVAVLTHIGIVSIRESGNEIVGIGHFRRLDNLSLGGILLGVPDVVVNGSGEGISGRKSVEGCN